MESLGICKVFQKFIFCVRDVSARVIKSSSRFHCLSSSIMIFLTFTLEASKSFLSLNQHLSSKPNFRCKCQSKMQGLFLRIEMPGLKMKDDRCLAGIYFLTKYRNFHQGTIFVPAGIVV